jgi:hypothetical protein
MDEDMSELRVEFRAQRTLLQALHDTQQEHSATLREHGAMLRDQGAMLRDRARCSGTTAGSSRRSRRGSSESWPGLTRFARCSTGRSTAVTRSDSVESPRARYG